MTENQGNDKVVKDNFIITRDWMRVYSFHGKFFHPSWMNDHEKYMTPHYANEYGTNKEVSFSSTVGTFCFIIYSL